MLAEAQENLGMYDAAERSLLRALQITRDAAEKAALRLEVGRVQFRQQRYEGAAETFGRAAGHRAYRVEASFWAARCYYLLERYGLAMHHIDQAAELAGDDGRIRELMEKIEAGRFGPPVTDAAGEQAPP
jgi:tetratricopeptide (TPR) repeat protein